MSELPYDRMSDSEKKKWHKNQSDPATHKDHVYEARLDEYGAMTFHCISCDVSIWLGELKGFEEETT